MALPWLAVGKLVLNNLDTIIGVVKPGFTRKKADTDHMDLLNQQIAELQAAASSNAEQIKQLAAQVKELVAALARRRLMQRHSVLPRSDGPMRQLRYPSLRCC
jgi:hypothetical protein